MKLNHLDLQVPDVQATAAFFAQHFGFALRSSPRSPAIAILAGSDGFALVLQRAHDGERYPEGFHVGFLVDDVAAVHAANARLTAAGAAPSDVIENNRGTLCYCRAPGDILVEVSCHRPR